MPHAGAGRRLRRFFEGQLGHVVWLGILLAGLYAAGRMPGFAGGSFLGLTTNQWVSIAVGNAIVHQVYVWVCWRAALAARETSPDSRASWFPLYAGLFFILIAARPLLALAVGWSNRGTLPIRPWIGAAISLILIVPLAYLGYSIVRYFGFNRATGIDHFDPAYRERELVERGIFRFTPNAMYVVGFFAMWIPAFLFRSVAALALAAFAHAYIWVHYFFTERPDMRRIYGRER